MLTDAYGAELTTSCASSLFRLSRSLVGGTKAELLRRGLWANVPGGKDAFDDVVVELVRSDHEDPASNEAAMAQLRITVKAADERRVGRAFSAALTELLLSSYRHDHHRLDHAVLRGVLAGAHPVRPRLAGGRGRRRTVDRRLDTDRTGTPIDTPGMHTAAVPGGPTVRAPLGPVAGARSGDKGGNANVGLWARTHEAFAWLAPELTVERFRALVPDAAGLDVERHLLPNLRAINFVVIGLLGEGVASSTRIDAQAKGLGEYLRAKLVDVRLGVAPAVISVVCLPKLRPADALELFLTGERSTAARAAEVGLVTKAVPHDQLDATVADVVSKLLLRGPNVLAAAKQLIRRSRRCRGTTPSAWTAELSAALFASDEAAAGTAAFRAKQPPPWAPQ